MRRLAPLLSLALLACGRTERIDSAPPPNVSTPDASPPSSDGGVHSALRVPAGCPIFAPGGGSVGSPFPSQMTALCAVDDTGAAYGVLQGSSPIGSTAVLVGGRELGLYFGFDPTLMFTADRLTFNGQPTLHVKTMCCSPSRMIPLVPQVVAEDTTGLLVSLGAFDTGPQEVVFYADLDAMFGTGGTFGATFYVNAAPP